MMTIDSTFLIIFFVLKNFDQMRHRYVIKIVSKTQIHSEETKNFNKIIDFR